MILFTIRLNQKVVILIDCVRDKQWIKMGNSQCVLEINTLGGLCEIVYHLKEFISFVDRTYTCKVIVEP